MQIPFLQMQIDTGVFLVIGIGVCIAVVCYTAADSLLAAVSSVRLRIQTPVKLKEPKPNTADASPTKNVLIGTVLGTAFMWQFPEYILYSAFGGAFLGYVVFNITKRINKRNRTRKRIEEIISMYETIQVYSDTKHTLYEALAACLPFTDEIRAPLERLLRSWPAGPALAIYKFGEEIGTDEAKALATVLQEAVYLGTERLSNAVGSEGKTFEEIKKHKEEAMMSLRPIIMTTYLALPILALMGTTLFPLAYYIIQQMNSINLSGV